MDVWNLANLELQCIKFSLHLCRYTFIWSNCVNVLQAIENCTLWAMDRMTFRSILLQTTSNKRQTYEKFLEDVPLLKVIKDVMMKRMFKLLALKKWNQLFEHIVYILQVLRTMDRGIDGFNDFVVHSSAYYLFLFFFPGVTYFVIWLKFPEPWKVWEICDCGCFRDRVFRCWPEHRGWGSTWR